MDRLLDFLAGPKEMETEDGETLRLLMLGEGPSKLWGAPQGGPRALTEKEKAECETYYRRQARREREKGKG